MSEIVWNDLSYMDQFLYLVADGHIYTTNSALLKAAFKRWPELV